MKPTHLITLLVSLVTLGAFATDASAMYAPTMGRFIQRDPAGYVDGMSLYGHYGLDLFGLIAWLSKDPDVLAAQKELQDTESGKKLIGQIELLEARTSVPVRVRDNVQVAHEDMQDMTIRDGAEKEVLERRLEAAKRDRSSVGNGRLSKQVLAAHPNAKGAINVKINPLDANPADAITPVWYATGDRPTDVRLCLRLSEVLYHELVHARQALAEWDIDAAKSIKQRAPTKDELGGMSIEEWQSRWDDPAEYAATIETNTNYLTELRALQVYAPDRTSYVTTDAQNRHAEKLVKELRASRSTTRPAGP